MITPNLTIRDINYISDAIHPSPSFVYDPERSTEILIKFDRASDRPHPDCDDSCHFNCTKGGQQPPECETAYRRRSMIERIAYELGKYTDLARRMDDLMNELISNGDYTNAKYAGFKRNCYKEIVNDLGQLIYDSADEGNLTENYNNGQI